MTSKATAYISKHWVKREMEEGSKGVYPIYRLALISLHDKLFKPHQQTLVEAALTLITRERNGEPIQTNFVRGLVECLVALGEESDDDPGARLAVYVECFEKSFLKVYTLDFLFGFFPPSIV